MSDVSINIDNRKDVLLLLLLSPGQSQEKNEPISGRTRYMKLVYLFYKELVRDLSSFNAVNEEKRHSFKPYHFGPFSKDVFDDIQFLENADLITEDAGGEPSIAESAESRLFYDEALIERIESQEEENEEYLEPIFKLTEKGVEFADHLYNSLQTRERKALQRFKGKFNVLPLATLLRYVYRTYPESATESKIKESIWA